MKSIRRDYKLSIALPSSLVSEIPHLREQTSVIGRIARIAVIHRIDDIYIYRDFPDESKLIRLILTYIETPQYLRKNLFGIREELRYVGILPPLRTPHHPSERRSSRLKAGEFREGVVLSENYGEYLVDIGIKTLVKVTGRGPSIGGRTTVLITSIRPTLMGKFAKRGDVKYYWGYGVHLSRNGLGKLASSNNFDLKYATSRLGSPFRDIESKFRARLTDAKSVLVAFGSHKEGIQEILGRKGLDIGEIFDFTANVVPNQGSVTVRTEEAMSATLALLGMIR